MFVLNSVLLGVGLAMDAVAVSMAEGMQEPKMKSERSLMLSGTFGFFQFIMPVLGFALVGTFFGFAKVLMKYVSAISTILLLYLSIKVFYSAYLKFRNKETEELQGNLMFQAIGTSVDALSLGFYLLSLFFRKSIFGFVHHRNCDLFSLPNRYYYRK